MVVWIWWFVLWLWWLRVSHFQDVVISYLLSYYCHLSLLKNKKMNSKLAFKRITLLQIKFALCWKWAIQLPLKKLACSYVQVCYLTRKSCEYTTLPCTQLLCLFLCCRGRRWAPRVSLCCGVLRVWRLAWWSCRLPCVLWHTGWL